MQTIEARISEAEALWQKGDTLHAAGDGRGAYTAYTGAHDLIMDCPRLHERAHRQLRKVSRAHGHRGEVIIDNLLVWLAPLGVFAAISFAMRSRVVSHALCRRVTTQTT
ncbi:MAG: hypothetical protein ACRESS_06700 [Stenotrophobium sp.]